MPKVVGRPFANTNLARFLEKRILELRPRKSQKQIADEAGFLSVNMLSMIKSGTSRLPLDRVPALAKSLECDPARLFVLALEQQDNALAVVVREILRIAVSANEAAWIEELRDASDHSDPTLTTKARRSLRAVFGK
ncbi:helix-turn-helix transcriptional regulator [Mesorhizobium sp. LHD-90]|uniref:helix-turn-helix domain-containing protein n=1 Tax=Mesorhizobium sp. LHD-90 TaxID=3071414 RepID=UPI0027E13957|nr:helix-turn-helix transcriptional regulator [Mesorhizobium sp. LHD-90]MDQ6436612.1 helix-turn-helix transcriptional regulator [Mesorhizobium sp. LHD-90]